MGLEIKPSKLASKIDVGGFYNLTGLAERLEEASKRLDVIIRMNGAKVIFNNPATILFVNGKKYVSKAHEEEFDEEKGLLMCLAKANGISHLDLQRMIKGATRQTKPTPTIEVKPNRLVGRPRKNKAEREIKAGDMVRILKSSEDYIQEIREMIGKVCEVKEVVSTGCCDLVIWQEDKSCYWFFNKDEVELV